MKRLILTSALGLSLLASAAATAGHGYVVNNVNLRSGPDVSYPSVGMLNAGAAVELESCVSGWSWCDVATPYGRGWIPGSYIQQDYQGRRVFVPEYGERIGIPFVVFNFDTYWGTYYRDRPWYGERERYGRFRPMYRPIAIDIRFRSQPSWRGHDEHGRNEDWRDRRHDDGHGHGDGHWHGDGDGHDHDHDGHGNGDHSPRDGYGGGPNNGGPNNNVEPRRPNAAAAPPMNEGVHPNVADRKSPQRHAPEPQSSNEQDSGRNDSKASGEH